ncbi:MAG: nucleoside deaminase [Candidatus Methanomethylophilaceae archaeon]|nr:nucleoside deaminase [Candidatus Methanomethylophilaceae archaeon]
MDSDERFLKMAVDEAFEGIRAGHGGPFGCVIVRDGDVVGRGHNRVLTESDPTAHGEVVAIRDACSRMKTFDLSGCTLYTSSEPCPMCRAAIAWANVGRVVFAASMKETEDVLGFRDQKMIDALRNGEDLTPSDRVTFDGYLEPFYEYRDRDGVIYRGFEDSNSSRNSPSTVSGCFLISHSQITSTLHPSDSRSSRLRLSRSTFRSNFAFQNSV